jgi:hypothetical protein
MKSHRFAKIPEHALKANLNLQAHRVLIAIALHADPAGWAWPSLATIDALAGTSRYNTCAAIDQLEKAGLLRRDSSKGGRANPTHYRIVGPPAKTGSESDPVVVSGNRVQIRPPLGPKTGSELDCKQGLTQTPEHTRTERVSERARARARVRESFLKFKSAYPSRGDHGDPETPARREFEAAVLDRGVDPEAIIAGAERYAAQVAIAGTEPRFVKMSANWLKDEGWADRPRPIARRRPVPGMA